MNKDTVLLLTLILFASGVIRYCIHSMYWNGTQAEHRADTLPCSAQPSSCAKRDPATHTPQAPLYAASNTYVHCWVTKAAEGSGLFNHCCDQKDGPIRCAGDLTWEETREARRQAQTRATSLLGTRPRPWDIQHGNVIHYEYLSSSVNPR